MSDAARSVWGMAMQVYSAESLRDVGVFKNEVRLAAMNGSRGRESRDFALACTSPEDGHPSLLLSGRLLIGAGTVIVRPH